MSRFKIIPGTPGTINIMAFIFASLLADAIVNIAWRGNTSPDLPKLNEVLIMTQQRGGSGNFSQDRERASEAGKKGGQQSGGNFKNDPERASEAGKKGGKNSHGGGRSSWSVNALTGVLSFADVNDDVKN